MNCAQTDALLDALLDDALTEPDRAALQAHCAGCSCCGEKLRATQALRDMFSEAAPELDVPLTAQAGWRTAVTEVAARRRRGLTRWAGGIAAALVVTIGGFFALRGPSAATDAAPRAIMEKSATFERDSVAVVEADGEAMESIGTAAFRAMPMVERRMAVEDLDSTCAYMTDLVREYEGTLEERRYEADGARCADLSIDLPAENAGDFLAAAAHYDSNGTFGEAPDVTVAEGRVSMLLVLEAKES